MSTDGTILVTGGSRGIGAATGTQLAGQGRKIVVVDILPEPVPASPPMAGCAKHRPVDQEGTGS